MGKLKRIVASMAVAALLVGGVVYTTSSHSKNEAVEVVPKPQLDPGVGGN